MTAKKKEPSEKAIRDALSAIGRKGGKARTAGLTPQERTALARRAARARWKKRKPRRQWDNPRE